MKPNWVCSNCGMWSTRKFSVKRHIINQHNGNAWLVPYIDYLVGRQSGLYPPSAQPEDQYKVNKNPLEIFIEEFWKEKARIAARGNRNHNFDIR
ncbi:MAG TPA: hypothetical protein VIZ62_12160 [Nitrososphaeraceae archaeon]